MDFCVGPLLEIATGSKRWAAREIDLARQSEARRHITGIHTLRNCGTIGSIPFPAASSNSLPVDRFGGRSFNTDFRLQRFACINSCLAGPIADAVILYIIGIGSHICDMVGERFLLGTFIVNENIFIINGEMDHRISAQFPACQTYSFAIGMAYSPHLAYHHEIYTGIRSLP